MTRQQIVGAILEQRVVAIVRLPDAQWTRSVVEAIHAGGVQCVEISLTTPGALRTIAELRGRAPTLTIGAGTVCTDADAEDALAAGAQFLVSPVTEPRLVKLAHAREAPILMGALTPTEIHASHRAGADLIKLFPASAVTPDYLSAIAGPFPQIRLVPTGGVGADNAAEWIASGAVALGVGGRMTDADAIRAGDFARLSDAARELLAAARAAG